MATCPAHLNLLDLITLTMLGERYKYLKLPEKIHYYHLQCTIHTLHIQTTICIGPWIYSFEEGTSRTLHKSIIFVNSLYKKCEDWYCHEIMTLVKRLLMSLNHLALILGTNGIFHS